jgi:hypothetical protein
MAIAMSLIITAAAAFHMLGIVLALLFIDRRVFKLPVSHAFLVILTFPDSSPSLVPSLCCTGHPDYPVLHLLDRLQFLSEAPVELFPSYRLSHGLLGLGDGVLEEDAWAHVPTEADALLGGLFLIK